MQQKYGVGIDCGTMNLVSARVSETGDSLLFRKYRNLFLSLPREQKRSLGRLKVVDFIDRPEHDDILLLSDKALDIANALGATARRPLQGGLLASNEQDGVTVLATMIKSILGTPQHKGEVCYYSVPAKPVDDPTKDVIYHTRVLGDIINGCGFTAVPANEAAAIVFAECESSEFTGIACSFGSGMTNVALVYKTIPLYEFSIAMGGDYIDERAASQIQGMSSNVMCSIKEQSGWSLLAPETPEQRALATYYNHLIKVVVHHIVEQFNLIKNKNRIVESIPVVISGGTSMVKGFLDMFTKEFKESKFPLGISEIRMSSNPLQAVARGLLVQAAQEEEDQDDT